MQEDMIVSGVYILPGNFITYQGVPLTTDTIKITVY